MYRAAVWKTFSANVFLTCETGTKIKITVWTSSCAAACKVYIPWAKGSIGIEIHDFLPKHHFDIYSESQKKKVRTLKWQVSTEETPQMLWADIKITLVFLHVNAKLLKNA